MRGPWPGVFLADSLQWPGQGNERGWRWRLERPPCGSQSPLPSTRLSLWPLHGSEHSSGSKPRFLRPQGRCLLPELVQLAGRGRHDLWSPHRAACPDQPSKPIGTTETRTWRSGARCLGSALASACTSSGGRPWAGCSGGRCPLPISCNWPSIALCALQVHCP